MIKKKPPDEFLLPEALRNLANRLEHTLGERLDELRIDIQGIEARLNTPFSWARNSKDVDGSTAHAVIGGETSNAGPPEADPSVMVPPGEGREDASGLPLALSCKETAPRVIGSIESLPTIRGSSEPDHVYVVQSCWQTGIVTKKQPVCFSHVTPRSHTSFSDEFRSYQAPRHSRVEMSRLILRPSSRKRLAWDVASMWVIGYDMIMIPFTLAFFASDNDSAFLDSMFWFCLGWWTFDIPLSFVSGFYAKGMEELRPRFVVFAYLRSWFLFDVSIVSADWSGVIFGSRQRGASMVRMGKTLRFLRVMRSLRLLRLTKVRRILEAIQDRITSEWFHIVLGVLKLSFLLLVFNHLLACVWWALSRATPRGTRSWAADERYAGSTLGYQYFTSLHWTITQFTPAGMEVSPQNFHERIFAVIVCLVAMIFFSNFVSSITAAMTQLRQLSSQTNKEFAVLRRFLRDRKIHGDLRLRIVRYAEHRVSMRKSETQEQDVTLLKLLSNPLKVELVVQSRAPVLTRHPFFMHYQEADADAMSQVCCNAVNHVLLSFGDVLFTVGVQCDHMVFVFRGGLVYFPEAGLLDEEDRLQSPSTKTVQQAHSTKAPSSHIIGSPSSRIVGSPSSHSEHRQISGKYSSSDALSRFDTSFEVREQDWCCEQALWTSWTHLGTMRATAMSELLLVSAASFRDVTLAHSRVAHKAARYGKAFVDAVNGAGGRAKTSDIAVFNPQSLAEDVFDSHQAERASTDLAAASTDLEATLSQSSNASV